MFLQKTHSKISVFSLYSKKGFTLIELLVVIAIISLLSSVVMSSVSSARIKARDAKRSADVKQLMSALELSYEANNGYPSIGANHVGYDIANLAPALGAFMDPLPTDPRGDSWHVYQYVRGPGTTYAIRIRYEDPNDHTDANGYCKIGVGVALPWWGLTRPLCW